MVDWKLELDDIIERKRIRSVFQPIVSLRDGDILGFEALSRIIGDSAIKNIEVLFEQAVLQGRIWELEKLCRAKSLSTLFETRSYKKKLFLNVNPLVMHDTKFRQGFTKEHLDTYHVFSEQVIIEITENSSVEESEAFQATVVHYKEQGYEIALDDVGSCYSGLNLICDIKPHFLKLDRKLVQNIHNDGMKRALIKSLVGLTDSLGMFLIAEGIEAEEELDALIEMGVHYGQGFLLGRPGEIIDTLDQQVLSIIKKCNARKNSGIHLGVEKYYIGNISTFGKTVPFHMMVEEVAVLFDKNLDIQGVTIIDNNNRAMGIVTRDRLSQCLGGRYGFSLHQRKKIGSIMEKKFLMVDCMTSISSVANSAMERENECLYDFVVVTNGGEYAGIVTVRDLLQKTIEIAVTTAKLQNPLTELPGNLLIEEEIEKAIRSEEKYTVVYFDLDNFKAFNDVYGFGKGDLAIKEFARILKSNISEEDFVGHIGGDDFVAIFKNHNCEYLCTRIIKDYEEKVHSYYSPEDRRNGYIETPNRQGEMERFPLLSVTAAMADNREKSYSSAEEISELLAARKKYKKNQKGKVAM